MVKYFLFEVLCLTTSTALCQEVPRNMHSTRILEQQNEGQGVPKMKRAA
jgi:hypothetical protein